MLPPHPLTDTGGATYRRARHAAVLRQSRRTAVIHGEGKRPNCYYYYTTQRGGESGTHGHKKMAKKKAEGETQGRHNVSKCKRGSSSDGVRPCPAAAVPGGRIGSKPKWVRERVETL